MKRSWYGSYSDSGSYKKKARLGGPRVQGSTEIMAKSASGSYRKRRRSSKPKRRIFRRRRLRYLQPWSTTVCLKTHSTQSVDAGAGVLTVQSYALSGCNDPFLAHDTSQPLGFDQWSALYRKYCVIGWKIKFDLVTTDNTHPTVVGFAPLTTSTGLASFAHYKETPGCKSVILTPDIDKGFVISRGNVEKYLYGGRKKGKILSDDDATALTTANPARMLYGHFFVQALDGTDLAAVYASITLEQIIVFFDPIIPARS